MKIVEHTGWHALADLRESLRAHSQLPYAVDLEAFDLPLHVGQENRKVLRNLLISNEVLGVLASVKLGDEILTSLLYHIDCIWELQVLLV